MSENRRLSKRESDDAWWTGMCRVIDPKMSCPQTLNITLFFDGTNNNDDEKSPRRDSLTQTHTNVARLHNAALLEPHNGIFKSYIPGVGTPFAEIGETLHSTKGKAFASGFGARSLWDYTRVLNAVYQAIRRDPYWQLIRDNDTKWLCDAGANGNMQGFKEPVNGLGVAHRQAVDKGRWPRTIRQVWINVIGFSRGAACARAFAHKLIHEWAPGGKLGTETGKYAIPYQVNFMGLFDTVASVGLPDSTRPTLNLERFAGHGGFTSGGAMAISERCGSACMHSRSTSSA
jgi:hypothetical protein